MYKLYLLFFIIFFVKKQMCISAASCLSGITTRRMSASMKNINMKY